MPWGRLDDDFHDGPKVAELLEEPEGLAAVGLWTLMFSWAHRNTRRPGRIPGLLPRSKVLAVDRVNASRLAGLLTKVGLWESREDGWQIHNFTRYLPSERKLAAQSANAHKRWNTPVDATGIPDSATGRPGDASGLPDGCQALGMGKVVVQVQVDDTPVNASVIRLCSRLADAIEANGSKRPVVGQRWHDAARLMMTRDGRTEEQVARAIDFCQGDEFWRANILSMPKLRQQYEQLRLHAMRGQRNGRATTDDRVRQALGLLDQDGSTGTASM